MASQVHEFNVEMTCEGCSNACKNVLTKLGDEVSDMKFDLETKKVHVTSTLSSDQLLETLKKAGKPVTYVGSKPSA